MFIQTKQKQTLKQKRSQKFKQTHPADTQRNTHRHTASFTHLRLLYIYFPANYSALETKASRTVTSAASIPPLPPFSLSR